MFFDPFGFDHYGYDEYEDYYMTDDDDSEATFSETESLDSNAEKEYTEKLESVIFEGYVSLNKNKRNPYFLSELKKLKKSEKNSSFIDTDDEQPDISDKVDTGPATRDEEKIVELSSGIIVLILQ